ncbi:MULTISPECIES: ABC transporter permease subunit [unclassified Diaminobutyricimonas]|uniref:ABC transporter permease n=1 Tax=unclassified Diaminobutyricimonas TaxID=2643261 RepID=UPI0012F4D7E4|nr:MULTISPECIES: ABC transporter permease subunit [unclassified Diaminobutyricimonas]
MSLFLEALAWIFSPERLVGSSSIPNRLAEHLYYTLVSMLIAAAIAIPAGLLIGHTGRGRQLAIALSGAARALPSLGLITILALLLGLDFGPVLIVLVVLAVPSILAGAYAGVEAIDRHTVDAARAMGMTEWQVLTRVELPLGLPLLIGGLRNATLQVVATATLAAYIGLGGLGRYIFSGLSTRNFEVMLGGAILVAVLALLLEGIFALLQRLTRAPALRRH